MLYLIGVIALGGFASFSRTISALATENVKSEASPSQTISDKPFVATFASAAFNVNVSLLSVLLKTIPITFLSLFTKLPPVPAYVASKRSIYLTNPKITIC